MKQVLAVGIAALLIAGALFLRNVLEDDDDGGGGGGGGGELVVACVRELREACEALDGVSELRIEDPAATIEAAAAGEIDAWVTFDPWPAIAAQQEQRDVFAGEPVAVATTQLYLLYREAALPPACGGAVTWTCVATATGSAAPALPPADGALGRLLLGHAAASWTAETRPGEPFAANDFELPEFQDWIGSLEFVRDPVSDMIQFAPAGPIATASTQAVFETVVASSRESGRIGADSTAASASVAVVVAGRDAANVAGRALADALTALGYFAGPDPATRTSGLPSPGVLLALQELA